jgi:hypothetical protein
MREAYEMKLPKSACRTGRNFLFRMFAGDAAAELSGIAAPEGSNCREDSRSKFWSDMLAENFGLLPQYIATRRTVQSSAGPNVVDINPLNELVLQGN